LLGLFCPEIGDQEVTKGLQLNVAEPYCRISQLPSCRATLKELEQPFLPESANQAPIGIYRDRFGEIVYNSHLQQHELRQAVEQSLRHRQPCALLIDEAQHIAKAASGRRLQDQVDCLKFLAQQSRTLI